MEHSVASPSPGPRPAAARGRVTATPTPTPEVAAERFTARLETETDPSDVHDDLVDGRRDIVVIDTRSPEAYAAAHIPGALNLPHRSMTEASIATAVPDAVVAVTYCWGPHCNAATRGALVLARSGRPVKEMIGGIEGWEKDGYPLVAGPEPGALVTSM